MGTRSQIIVALAAGGFKAVYCHWDGYIEHNGRILHTHYNSQGRAEELVGPGDLSSLDARCDKPKGHTFEKRAEGCSVYYARDRGEKDATGRTGPDLKSVWPDADSWCEYVYVWKDGQWFVSKSTIGRLRPLAKSAALKKALSDEALRAVKVASCAAA